MTAVEVGTPIKVGSGGSATSTKFDQGQYQVVITGKFSDNTSQVLYTGTVTV